MDNQSIVFESRSPISWIKLNRPTVYNAIRRQDLVLLRDIIEQLENRPPRALILTAIERGFCSGIDLKESREANSEFAHQRATLMHEVLYRLRNLPFPVITAIDGVAAGLGCELAISGDLRIASASSRFGYPEPRVAVPSPTFHLSHLIGLSRTQDMLLTARWVEADEALTWGLVTRISNEPQAAATALATELLELSPISLARTKENLAISIDGAVAEATRHHIEHVAAAAGTEDRKEALSAFAERRKPVFKGR